MSLVLGLEMLHKLWFRVEEKDSLSSGRLEGRVSPYSSGLYSPFFKMQPSESARPWNCPAAPCQDTGLGCLQEKKKKTMLEPFHFIQERHCWPKLWSHWWCVLITQCSSHRYVSFQYGKLPFIVRLTLWNTCYYFPHFMITRRGTLGLKWMY